MVMPKFRKGDRVKLVPPQGRVFDADTVGFRQGLTQNMIDIVNESNSFTIQDVFRDGTVTMRECGYYWDQDWLQLIDKEEKKVVSVDFILSNKETKAVDLNRVGITIRNPQDRHDESIAMIVSLARMLNIHKDKITRIIDVLYDDMPKELGKATIKELISELQKRI